VFDQPPGALLLCLVRIQNLNFIYPYASLLQDTCLPFCVHLFLQPVTYWRQDQGIHMPDCGISIRRHHLSFLLVIKAGHCALNGKEIGNRWSRWTCQIVESLYGAAYWGCLTRPHEMDYIDCMGADTYVSNIIHFLLCCDSN